MRSEPVFLAVVSYPTHENTVQPHCGASASGAVSRKLLVELWRFVEAAALPKDTPTRA